MRLRGTKPLGTVKAIGGLVRIEYEYRPGTVTVGLYPAEQLELVPGLATGTTGATVLTPPPSPPSQPSRDTKPRATTKDILA